MVTRFDLRLGDCLDPVTGLASLADGSVDHVITDPPFEAEAHTLQRRVKRGGGVMEVEPLSFDPITAEHRASVSREFARLARRWVIVFCQIEAADAWRECMVAAGLTYRRTCIWVKPDGMPQYSGDRPGMGYETVVVCHAPGKSRWNGGGKHGVYTFNKNDRDAQGAHPTKKPDALMEQLVRDFTDPGELICDPFAGSGTTGVAAIRLGRRFVGWERDPKYHAAAVRRLEGTHEQPELFSATKTAKPKQLGLIGGGS